MASGKAPSEGMRLKIRPLLPEGEVAKGRGRDWLPKEICKQLKWILNDAQTSNNISRKYRLSNTSALSPAINK